MNDDDERTGNSSYEPIKDYERDWEELWAPIVAPGGVLNLEQLKKELSDYRWMIRNTSAAFEDVTSGAISKPHTLAREVGREVDERERKYAEWLCDEGECKCVLAKQAEEQ